MRLISYNYSQIAQTVITASSSNPNFPVSNIRHEHRSKEWRSSGTFIIDSSNNELIVDEGSGDLTATLSVGTYSISGLIAEIELQLAAVCSNEYSLSFSEANGLWTIESDDSFTLVGTSSLLPVLGFNQVDQTGTSLVAPRAAIHTEEFLTFDLKTTEDIDSVVLLWGKGQYNLSSDAEIRVQANATNNFSSPAIDELLTFNNDFETASHYFTTPQSYRYWRVVIKDPNNPLLYVNLGVLVLGLQEALDNPENGFSYTQDDSSKITRTDFGQEYADIYPVTATLSLDFSVMEYSTAEKFILFYQRVGNRSPIYVAVDPENAVFNKDCFSIYGKFSGSLTQKHAFFSIFDSGLTVREVN